MAEAHRAAVESQHRAAMVAAAEQKDAAAAASMMLARNSGKNEILKSLLIRF
jgi:hypothetical protein